MTASGISEEVAQFIASHLTSFEQLETLLLLQRDPQRAWTPAQLAAELRTSDMSARQTLDHLVNRRLATRVDDVVRYQAATTELDRSVRALATVYRERRVAVINLIFAKPKGPLLEFADAFRIGGKEPNDG